MFLCYFLPLSPPSHTEQLEARSAADTDNTVNDTLQINEDGQTKRVEDKLCHKQIKK